MSHFEDLTTQCIRCGFCLEDCPTFVTTGNELESPRGRIYLIRSAIEGKLDWVKDVSPHTDLCLGCRACETACPSGVQYGAILEIARQEINNRQPHPLRKAFLATTTNATILKSQLALSRLLPGDKIPTPLSRLLSGQSAEVNLPQPQKVPQLPEITQQLPHRGEIYFLEGCAMKVLYPRVHLASKRLLTRLGFTVRETTQGCCGALHAHNGEMPTARTMANKLIASFPDNLPIVVNSAGCGSTMKEYHHLLAEESNDKTTEDFTRRVIDISDFLLQNGLPELLQKSIGLSGKKVTYHDACHLAHGQKITLSPRNLIQSIPGIEYVELPEASMCCGSAGIYNVLQPTMARTLLDRKVNNIQSIQPDFIATGNPGCHGWINQGCQEQSLGTVLHTAELLEASFVGVNYFA
jgi:glycolate oxidase iron-sulfur subunit